MGDEFPWGGFLADPPKLVVYLLSLRAFLCRVCYTDSLHGLMHRREQQK